MSSDPQPSASDIKALEEEWQRFLHETAVGPAAQHFKVVGSLFLVTCIGLAILLRTTPKENPMINAVASGVTIASGIAFFVIWERRRKRVQRRQNVVQMTMIKISQATDENALKASLSILNDLGADARGATPLLQSIRDAAETSPRMVELCNETLGKITPGGATK